MSSSAQLNSHFSLTQVSTVDAGGEGCKNGALAAWFVQSGNLSSQEAGGASIRSPVARSRVDGLPDVEVPLAEREAIYAMLAEVMRIFESANLLYVVGGGLAAEAYHLRECANDVDLFVRTVDAPRAGEVLSRAGFRTWVEDARWLYKASRDGVTVDVIHESKGLVRVGDETMRRARLMSIHGVLVRVMPPEDLFVMKALAATSRAPKHWLDAVHLLTTQPMDWAYLVSRVGQNPRKVLRAIVQGHEEGARVPAEALIELVRRLED